MSSQLHLDTQAALYSPAFTAPKLTSPSADHQHFAAMFSKASAEKQNQTATINHPPRQTTAQGPSLQEAAQKMEAQLALLMVKTMDKAAGEGGLLGKAGEGLGYFRDLFFQEVADQLVNQKGLGFSESLLNTYKTNNLNT